jgi:hypothetical protein
MNQQVANDAMRDFVENERLNARRHQRFELVKAALTGQIRDAVTEYQLEVIARKAVALADITLKVLER